MIRDLPQSAQDCLMATCFITKSDQAIAMVPEDSRKTLPADSEQFITYYVTHYSNRLPIYSLLSKEASDLLRYAFYENAHARQILDLEGGQNMLTSLRAAISNKTMDYVEFNLWYARWIINIAGLDGHLCPQGSSYLTQPVANGIFALKQELDQLWINPDHPVLTEYMRFRARQLDVKNLYLAALGALMRQYTPIKGHQIQKWFLQLPEDMQKQLLDDFAKRLKDTKATPTFQPPLLLNLLDLGCSVSDTLTLFIQIEAKATKKYLTAIAAGEVLVSTPLSYRDVAFKDKLRPILDYFMTQVKNLPEFEIDSTGNVYVTAQALKQLSSIEEEQERRMQCIA